VVTGLVLDSEGTPIAGARIEGQGRATVTRADGTFSLSVIDASAPLTASAPLHASQTIGPPFAYALPALAAEVGGAFTVSGAVSPGLAGITVMYADEAGTVS